MNAQVKQWFAASAPNATTLQCPECGESLDLDVPQLDHHPRICPACAVERVFLSLRGRMVQIVLTTAPTVLVAAIRAAQHHLDELEFVELVCAIEELMDNLPTPAGEHQR